MAKAKLYYTISEKLPIIPIVDGQIIFVSDSHEVCLDMHNERVSFSTIYDFDLDLDRRGFSNPRPGFYFVKETNVLWRYQNEAWQQITSGNPNPLVFREELLELPDEGTEDSLYIVNDGIYRWKADKEDYQLVANVSKWES